MYARQLEQLIASTSPRTPADLDIRTRKLRAAGHVKVHGRGLSVHHLTAPEACWMIVAAAATPVASDCVDHAKAYFGLHTFGRQFLGVVTFAELMSTILGDYTLKNAKQVTKIALLRFKQDPDDVETQIAVEFDWVDPDGESARTLYIDRPRRDRHSWTREPLHLGYLADAAIIGSGLLMDVAKRLSGTTAG